MKDGPLGNSFRDPSGFVYRKNGIIYRQLNDCCRDVWGQFISSGLCENLIKSGDLISHEPIPDAEIQTDHGWIVIKPEPVGFWSYPYEWCFGQLKDAALATLRIQQTALGCGMSMKDASAYNIQFVHGRPILIDSLSFEPYDPAKGWNGFRQFCMQFFAPLCLMSMTDHRLGELLRVHLGGIPIEVASRLLPLKSWAKFSTLIYIHLQAIKERRCSRLSDFRCDQKGINLDKMVGLIENLESSINKMEIHPSSTWVNYYDSIHYGNQNLIEKEKIVKTYLVMVAPKTVWDFGANEGHFSRIAAQKAASVVAFDSDMASVELNYRKCKSSKINNLLPLYMDLTNPSPRLGWGNNETINLNDRGNVDLILSLALIHHLVIANNIPFNLVAKQMASLTMYLVIEFVPKSDPMVQKLLCLREDIFTDYDEQSFEHTFLKFFEILKTDKIGDTGRSIYLMKSRWHG